MKNIELKLYTLLAVIGLAFAVYASTPTIVMEKSNETDSYLMIEPFSSDSLLSYSSLEASPNES